jgi:hypothetical protein
MAQNLCDRGSRDVQKRHRHGVPEASILGSGKWKFLSAALSLGRPDKKPALALFSAFLHEGVTFFPELPALRLLYLRLLPRLPENIL